MPQDQLPTFRRRDDALQIVDRIYNDQDIDELREHVRDLCYVVSRLIGEVNALRDELAEKADAPNHCG